MNSTNGPVLPLSRHQKKSVKALIQALGGEAWGHSVTALIDALPEDGKPQHLRGRAAELDQAYIPSRYPNAHPIGFPGNMYTRAIAERLIGYARERSSPIAKKG